MARPGSGASAPCACHIFITMLIVFVSLVSIGAAATSAETAATASASKTTSASMKTTVKDKTSTSPRGARELPSQEQLAEIRRVVELVRESRDQLPPAKLAQLARQLRQLRARIDAARESEDEAVEGRSAGSSTEAASGLHQVRSLSGGFSNDLSAHTLDADAKSTLFYDDIKKGAIEAPPSKDSMEYDFYGDEDAKNDDEDGDYDFDFSDGNHGNTGASISVGVSSGLHAFNGKTQASPVHHDGGKRVIAVGTSFPVPHDPTSYGPPKSPGSGGVSSHKVHPMLSGPASGYPVDGDFVDSPGDARRTTGTRGGSSGGVDGRDFGPPKGAISFDDTDAFADSTTARSFTDHSHQARGQLFHDNYIRGGFQSGGPHGATIHVAPAVGPHAGTLVVPGGSPHLGAISPHSVTPASVSVHIGIGGHEPVVGYTPPAHVSPEEHLSVERPRSGGKIIFPVSGPHHAEASYVAPPPDVHVTHVEEHVTRHVAPVKHVQHVEEHVYEQHHVPHSSHVTTTYHQPSHVKEHHESYSSSHHESPSYVKPHDASQYGPPHVKHVPVSYDPKPYVPQSYETESYDPEPYVPHPVSHSRPVHITHYKKRPGLLDNLLRPFRRLKHYLFGGYHGGHKPVVYTEVQTPHDNYYEYGAAAVAYPKKCRCIEAKSVLGVLVAGVAAAGLVAYIYALTTSNSTGFGRAVEGPERASLARLMLQEACSLGADAEGMWNGTVWIGDGNDEGDDVEGDDSEGKEESTEKAQKSRGTATEVANRLSLKTLSDAKRNKQKLLEEELQILAPRVSRQLRSSGTPAAPSHHVVKKPGASDTSPSTSPVHEDDHRTKRSAAILDQETLASGSFHMVSFDGMDIPMRHSPRDPGLPHVPLTQRPVFRPPPPRPFTPDLPDDDFSAVGSHVQSDDFSEFGHHDSDFLEALFSGGILDRFNVPDPSGVNYRFSRRMDLVDDSDPSDFDRSDSDPPLSYVDSLPDGTSFDNVFSNSSSNSSHAVKATRDLPFGSDLLSAAASLLPMLDLGPFQPLTKAFQADAMEDRSSVKPPNRATSHRKRMKNMFKGIRQFVTKSVPSLMKRTAYDHHCGCIPLTAYNVGLVGAPVFAVIASGLVLAFLIAQSTNQGVGRKRSEDAAVSATEELAGALDKLITAEEKAEANSTDADLLRGYYRSSIAPVAKQSPQLAALGGALEATSIECSRYYMCEMALLATNSGEPLDIGVPLLSLPVSWMLTSTQGGEFGQYCSSAVLGSTGGGNCALLYPGCNEV